MTDLTAKKCIPCEGGTPALDQAGIDNLLSQTPQWQYDNQNQRITRVFKFKGYGKTMAFVNAVAWVAHQEGHHPDMEVTFNTATVHFTTHAANGLTENDFICAAKVDALGAA